MLLDNEQESEVRELVPRYSKLLLGAANRRATKTFTSILAATFSSTRVDLSSPQLVENRLGISSMMKDTAVWMHSQSRGLFDLIDHILVGTSGSFPSYLSLAAAGAVTMGLGYYLTKNNNGRITPLVDPLNQTVEQQDGSRVTAYLKDGNLLSYVYEDVRTLYEGVRRGARVSNNGPMLGRRVKHADGTEPYEWISYNEVIDRSNDVSIAFRELGIPVGNDTHIGIYSKNRPEWIITELAAYNFGNVIVPIYETLGFEACVFILNQTEMQLVVCDAVSKAIGLIKQNSNCPHLKTVVVMEPLTEELRTIASENGVHVLTFDDLEKMGREAQDRPAHQPPKPDDLATICYTSGTTGTPKGVMLTHGNVVADGVSMEFFKYTGFNVTDVMISFLPLAHMLERVIESVCFAKGARVGFYRGDIRLLAEDIKELRPTVVPVVPRVLNRLYDKVMTEVNKSYVKKMLFNLAIKYKAREMHNFVIRNDGFFDNVVFKKVREGMGGRVRLMVTGSAPLSENVLTFVRAAMGCVVVEGYGQTECVAACTVSMEGDSNAGHVGMAIPSASIKLVDVPELNYFAKDGAGEICVKGPIVFRGYYKNEEQTKEVLDEDGWLHTGDIGRWTNEGTLKIVDRKKHIFKLAQGEYVAPEKIENIYVRSRFVAQSFVYGESLKSCLIAIVVPDPEEFVPTCKKQLNLEGTLQELCMNKDAVKMVLDDMIAVGKKGGLFSFEQVKAIKLCPDMFTVENDLLTPTLKSKRPKLKSHFASELEAMYSTLE
ncbi:putative long-chain-fatty-acid CoA ligase 5 [Teladorsagia circumcincta]|uniref:Long-chain-fatty-acid--CoA ligase n=1 Tax=Teladorsagia circumcincta TaxID=45464 RepID=A0A2G9UWH5_TELCI|nr:putative long-chain-fatty-acid CoA ligase 5 [Teladorsagia circumcincta]